MRITFGDQYPAKPPKVRFTSEMFHPNGESQALVIEPASVMPADDESFVVPV